MWHEERLLIDGELVEASAGAAFPTINGPLGHCLAERLAMSTREAAHPLGP